MRPLDGRRSEAGFRSVPAYPAARELGVAMAVTREVTGVRAMTEALAMTEVSRRAGVPGAVDAIDRRPGFPRRVAGS
ncbi:hypothetical protein ACFQ51_38510 [Streptomyces kaempferi]